MQPRTDAFAPRRKMNILVINSGSSSVKFSLFDATGSTPASLFEGEASGIGGPEAAFSLRDAERHELSQGEKAGISSTEDAIALVAHAVSRPEIPKIEAIGYRVVHPGATLNQHVRITDEVLKDLREAAEFAPLHDPSVLKIIEEMMRRFPAIEHYACFDTVFHETMPPEATTYPLPLEYRNKGVRRYGFHGLSCESIVVQLRKAGSTFPRRMVIAHLGAGCSVTALVDGRSIDTTMGLTPTGGVVMATRPGDLDPGLMLYLLRQTTGDKEAALDKIETMLNHASGMAALSGVSGDMRAIRAAAAKGDSQALLALKIFTRTVKKTVGGYLTLMGGLDALAFAGGIGEHDPASRAEILFGLDTIGISLDAGRNAEKKNGLRRISRDGAGTEVFVVPAEEDLMIALHVARLARV